MNEACASHQHRRRKHTTAASTLRSSCICAPLPAVSDRWTRGPPGRADGEGQQGHHLDLHAPGHLGTIPARRPASLQRTQGWPWSRPGRGYTEDSGEYHHQPAQRDHTALDPHRLAPRVSQKHAAAATAPTATLLQNNRRRRPVGMVAPISRRQTLSAGERRRASKAVEDDNHIEEHPCRAK